MHQHPVHGQTSSTLEERQAHTLPRADVATDPPRHLSEPDILMWFMGVFGGLGAVTGLVVGLATYAPTAPVAAVEAGIPATVLGTVLGGVVLAVRAAHRHLTR